MCSCTGSSHRRKGVRTDEGYCFTEIQPSWGQNPDSRHWKGVRSDEGFSVLFLKFLKPQGFCPNPGSCHEKGDKVKIPGARPSRRGLVLTKQLWWKKCGTRQCRPPPWRELPQWISLKQYPSSMRTPYGDDSSPNLAPMQVNSKSSAPRQCEPHFRLKLFAPRWLIFRKEVPLVSASPFRWRELHRILGSQDG